MVAQNLGKEKTSEKPKTTRRPGKCCQFINYVASCERQNVFSIIVALVATVVILFISFDECKKCFENVNRQKPKIQVRYREKLKTYWVYGRNVEGGHLHNVFEVLGRVGYQKRIPGETDDEWDLLWAHDYPFRALHAELQELEPHQRVNHFPGCGHITNKVDLATSGLKYIPPAFKLPEHKEKLLEYVRNNPKAEFVQKNNDHRNIKIANVAAIDLNRNGTFIQRFIDKPLLVGGYKFDIGVYTVITSIDPLRVYIYNGDALLRFCPVQYHPFDPEHVDKYVVGDDYLPTWEVPGLKGYYTDLGFGMKESLNAYIRSEGRDPAVIWERIEDALRTVIADKESKMIAVVNRFRSTANFFELMRFDFVVDEDLNVYLMEANMSPNLSSAHFPSNKLLFEQVIYNLLSVVGISQRIHKDTLEMDENETRMTSHDKNIVVYPEECNSKACRNNCEDVRVCGLCRQCLTEEMRYDLLRAHTEHVNRADCKRIFPPSVSKSGALPKNFHNYLLKNQMMYRWFLGKCLLDSAWCN